jgi:RNA polymerase sigma-70 factor (ECF subfamily)
MDLAALRPELLAHCYRMLGSIHDAEDAVQETLVRAWRGYDGFEGRASPRRWAYAIATRVCLTALDQRTRRALPSGLGTDEVAWLEPLPDALLHTGTPDPAGLALARSGIRLAFVAALQHLSPRQRSALVLGDVLGWPVAEVAEALGTTPASVNSALQRARAQLRRLDLDEDQIAEPAPGVLDRYAAAFEAADLPTLAGLLSADVTLEMPPRPDWYAGRDATLAFLRTNVLRPGAWQLVPARVNNQPAFIVNEADGTPHGLQVLDIHDGRLTRLFAFLDPALARRAG